jgi:hypothetical protein
MKDMSHHTNKGNKNIFEPISEFNIEDETNDEK